MMASERSRLIVVRGALVAALVAVLSSCTGSDEDYEVSIGTNARSASMHALGFALVSNGSGTGRLVGTLINRSSTVDYLQDVNIEAEHGGPVRTTLVGQAVPLMPSEPVRLAASERIMAYASELPEGRHVELTLGFRRSMELEWMVPVEPRLGPYAEIEVTSPPDGVVAPKLIAGSTASDRAGPQH